MIEAFPGPYERVEVDCRHQVGLSSTAIAGLVRLADEYAVPHGRRLALVEASPRIRRMIKHIRLDDLIECGAGSGVS